MQMPFWRDSNVFISLPSQVQQNSSGMDTKVCNVVLELESWWEKMTPLHLKVRGDFERSKDKKEKSLRKKQILLVSIGVLSLSLASPHQSTSPPL